uniref:Murine leukemia virus integrase C-terminal domain-containing protein n=1 Tax=Labrus bergylta TaxID=56723 RepID=A0A3Q3G045_9LABR
MQSQPQSTQLPPQPLDEQKTNAVQPGDKVFVKVFRRKWFNERREGPFEVVRSTGTAVQVKGSPTWYHLSHCIEKVKCCIKEVNERKSSIFARFSPRHSRLPETGKHVIFTRSYLLFNESTCKNCFTVC